MEPFEELIKQKEEIGKRIDRNEQEAANLQAEWNNVCDKMSKKLSSISSKGETNG